MGPPGLAILARKPLLFNGPVFGEGYSAVETRQPDDEWQNAIELERFQAEVNSLQYQFTDLQTVVLIDRIDELWDDNEESKLAIVGLIKAVHELNSSLGQTSTILFLRSDIYDTLRFTDKDKFHTLEERVTWTETELKELLAIRGKVSAGLESNDTRLLWGSIFDYNVGGEESFEYMFRRSLKRPRELIQFCNNAASIAQDKGHDKIFADDILDAERQYSIWKLGDLATEFAVQYPYLEEIIKLFQVAAERFLPSEFSTVYDASKEKLEAKYPVLASISMNGILQILYVVGLLGAEKQDGDSPKDIYVYDNPGLILANQKRLVIHPAFHSGLGVEPDKFSVDSATSSKLHDDAK